MCAREREQKKRSSLKVVRPADPRKTSSYYEHIKKPQDAIRRSPTVFRSIYATSNVNKPRSSLYPLFFCRRLTSTPLWNHPSSTFLLPFPFFLFPGFILQRALTPSPLLLGARSINARFLRWPRLDWGTALPSMGTKTCRQHREQETTNCCKLRNANAHLSADFFVSLVRFFIVFRLPLHCLAYSSVFSTRKYVLSHLFASLPLLIIMQFCFCFLSNAMPYVSVSCQRPALRIRILIDKHEKRSSIETEAIEGTCKFNKLNRVYCFQI